MADQLISLLFSAFLIGAGSKAAEMDLLSDRVSRQEVFQCKPALKLAKVSPSCCHFSLAKKVIP